MNTALPEDTDFIAVLRKLIGFDCQLEIRKIITWRHQLLIAERYRDRRVFMAGAGNAANPREQRRRRGLAPGSRRIIQGQSQSNAWDARSRVWLHLCGFANHCR